MSFHMTFQWIRGDWFRSTVRCVDGGFPLQYSVFLIPATPSKLRTLLAELEAIIDPRLDDIRVYPLPATVDIVQLGRGTGTDPAGIDLFAEQPPNPRKSTLVV